MFASFIYTECVSAGPFKRESGFKFKSVMEFPLTGEAVNSTKLEARLNQASAAFLPYKAPTIDPFMKPEEFEALDKQWSLQELSPGSFMFTRLFTSGVSNGRPDNPFHQGFIFDTVDFFEILDSTSQMSGLANSRPADFVRWHDWSNPRGDDELEAAELEEDNPPMPAVDSTEWALIAERLFEFDVDESLQITSGFASAIFEGRNFGIDTGDLDEYLDWVSLLTHLVPAQTGWSTQFTSNEAARLFSHQPAKLSLFRSDAHVPRVTVNDWANLVSKVIESCIFSQVDQIIGTISKALSFDPNNGLEALSALPLACAFIDQESVDADDLDAICELSADLLSQMPIPAHWRSEGAMNEAFELLERTTAAVQKFKNGEEIYQQLSRLTPSSRT